MSLSNGGAERAREFVEGLRIDPVLLFQDARREDFSVIPRKNRHARLSEDRAGVEFGGHKVHRAAVLREPLRERAFVGVEAAQIRQ